MSYKLNREEKRSPKNGRDMLLKLEIEEQHQFATTLLSEAPISPALLSAIKRRKELGKN
ncbi:MULTISPECIES: hypothetical protein [Pectobacterium]|uniref:hypothetical protein n=1 Tax=Pectobacterium TaxID=122277 RepID=UPI000AFEFB4D|nr:MULTISPECIES: hypothetical protein [Pectobacterium]MBA0163371.1 hypothetical protein [Pectobacterium versatile]MBA0169794.1 hypothetical protein [Pectobacterium versatile]MBK4824691.1 hypothetical protein [Pectobacterium carotovorum subsp. carotovorum]MBN3058368.1 hypothetical protein [Pectobacterium versatile]MBN3193284.1 hypothetical protein [Pectobacterium versatile]